ncbi:Metallo-dependent phosphatase-like protein [Achaetomium macrosporum]|uniref:Metallo-dependent phosphatase-like protein n=1 Tax=Achaetomium macrosporum TaxID=79813 RepID=A0AAN7CHK0_9PEZI|nr:Metallo-dependent phosphatase-like protein [Achaetomium macrosporum]
MAIQVLSDLHLEAPKAYDVFEIEPKAPYLALLGDIGNVAAHEHDYLGFLTRQLRQFRAVIFVPGNHEAYHSSWPETLEILRTFQGNTRKDLSLGEFILLDRGVFRLPDSNTVILGCSLFSYIPPESCMAVRMGLNDFFQTDDWDVNAHNEMHKRDLSWLNAQVAELEASDTKIIIFSHWSPTLDTRAIDPKHLGSRITSAFSADLSGEKCFTSGKVKLWAFGHTHYNCDFISERDGVGPLRLMANQRGYYFAQSEGFNNGKTVEV